MKKEDFRIGNLVSIDGKVVKIETIGEDGINFDVDYGVDTSPIDNTEITTTILYFSKEELARFKKLCKLGIKKEFGE